MKAALSQQDRKISTQLFHMPVLLLQGSAQRLLEHVGYGERLRSQRRLVAEYEPAISGRETSLLPRGACSDFQV